MPLIRPNEEVSWSRSMPHGYHANPYVQRLIAGHNDPTITPIDPTGRYVFRWIQWPDRWTLLLIEDQRHPQTGMFQTAFLMREVTC